MLDDCLDPIHPFKYGEVLARLIPKAEFREITAKGVSLEQHYADVQRVLAGFLCCCLSTR